MAGTYEYINEYGAVPFAERPFGAADAFSLCQAFYMPVEKVWQSIDKEALPFRELAMKAFDLAGGKHKPVGLVLSNQISVRLVQLARAPRFCDMIVSDLETVLEEDPFVQFAAVTYRLSDGTVVVLFRGTDDSIIGWKEDLDILARRGIPSHQLAVEYLERIAGKYDGKLVICGHSKGGNLALFAALNCTPGTRARIRTLYNLEGPGFDNYDYLDTPEYAEILPRYEHFVPQASLVGVMLAHDNDYTVVKSSRLTGPFQHDLSSWQVAETEPVLLPGLNFLGRVNDVVMREIMERIPKENYGVIDRVSGALVRGSGQIYLTGFVKKVLPSVKGAAEAWKHLDEESRKAFIGSFAGAGRALLTALKEARVRREAPAPEPVPAPAMA